MLRMMTLYFAAGFCLPEPEAGESKVDLLAYYDRARRFSYGSLAAGLMIFWVYNAVVAPADWRTDLLTKARQIAPWVILMFVRWRWLNLLLLAFPLVGTTLDLLHVSLGR